MSSQNLFLNLSKMTADLSDEVQMQIFELSYNGIIVASLEGCNPVPFNCGVGTDVANNKLILYGDVMTAGGFGSCTVTLPLSRSYVYGFMIEPRLDDESSEKLQEILGALGVTFDGPEFE